MSLDPSAMFKVLGVETRVRIIEHLKSNGPLGVKKLAKLIGITPAAVSQHLKILKQAGLVRSERTGYWIPYSINEEAMAHCKQILSEVCTCGCEGTGNYRDKEMNDPNLESLIHCKQELQNELRIVQRRIIEIMDKKN